VNIEDLFTAVDRIGENGNKISNIFRLGDRYTYDFNHCTSAKGWEQYDTDQDDWYFGVWVHKAKKLILTYAEGDLALSSCGTAKIFNLEIAAMNKFYGQGKICTVVGKDGCTTFHQDRMEFVIKGAS